MQRSAFPEVLFWSGVPEALPPPPVLGNPPPNISLLEILHSLVQTMPGAGVNCTRPPHNHTYILCNTHRQQSTPSYKKTILESKQPVSGIDFFFRFSPRLSENDYSWVKFIAKFVPTASNLRYFGLNCCVFPVKSVVHAHNQLAHDS